MTDMAKAEKSGLTLSMVSEMTGFSVPDIALVARTVAVGAPLQELAVFLHSCRQLHLDPLLRQAYWIRRGNPPKGALQVGIDGFRAIADSSGVYAGAEPIEYRGRLEWTYKDQKIIVPELARAVIWKIVGGHKSPFTGEAYWTEFCPATDKESHMWARMPKHMLGKVAEAQALRRAFPAQLGALTLEDDESSLEVAEQAPPRRSQAELAAKHAAIYDHAYDLPEPQQPEPEAESAQEAQS
jgi:phage recombination protein Bet